MRFCIDKTIISIGMVFVYLMKITMGSLIWSRDYGVSHLAQRHNLFTYFTT